MSLHQLSLFADSSAVEAVISQQPLPALLSADLDFHGEKSSYASHNFHAFPAKYPPQLPKKFIQALTTPGEVVLDPMMGSGTTVVETYLSGRQAIGFDIDPLAIKLARVKTTPLDRHKMWQLGNKLLAEATHSLESRRAKLEAGLCQRFDEKSLQFLAYWFAAETQLELLALIQAIEQMEDEPIRTFFEVVFSATIITKSGGVSLALDLAHTRPHRAKLVYDARGNLIAGQATTDELSIRQQILTKKLHSPLEEFNKRFQKNLASLPEPDSSCLPSLTKYANAQRMPLDENSVDLIVTSPPTLPTRLTTCAPTSFP